MENEPLVSVGVPVYNDAPWLRNALDHIINQDYKNLEIILADDGSTDGAREICREYAQRDRRIRLIENKHNLGAFENHKFVFDVSTGDYFAWGSGHDYYHLTFVSKTLESLQASPSVVMCCSRSVFIDEKGEIFRTPKGWLDTRNLPPDKRFGKLLVHLNGGTGNIFYGLYRQEALAQMNLSRKVLGWDVIMLGELSLLGEIIQVDEVLYYRMMNGVECGKERVERHVKVIVGVSGGTIERIMPYLAMINEYMNMIEKSKLSATEKQSLNEDILKEAHRIRAIIAAEVQQFVAVSTIEMCSPEPHLQTRRHRAVQILDGLNKANMLGYETNELLSLQQACRAVLSKSKNAQINSPTLNPLSSLRHKMQAQFTKSYAALTKKAKQRTSKDSR